VSGSGDILVELLSMKNEVARALSTGAHEVRNASRTHLETFLEQIKGTVHELSEALEDEEQRLEALVAARPIPALATAFALGLLVGASMRTLR
jgi:ElaB/YqjD/DUF883 family membrane-anchored ribosome-binding protein